VRRYECDAYGHLNNANYLRYMQETAFDASTAAGYDFDRYTAMGRLWTVRETDIEYLNPLQYADRVEVKTWVIDFRRVRSRRAYEFRKSGSSELAARASTDWVFVDDTGNPATVPPELIAAFFPEGMLDVAPPRGRFPTAPPPPPGVFTMRRRVTWQDIDPEQHVNNAVYLNYVEDCGVQVASARGWPMERMRAEGFGILARRHQIEYRVSALLDDGLELATWVSDAKRATATRHYTITRVRDGALLARVHTLYVWVDVKTGRPIRIPPHFLADFASNIV
jgi:acyl-CoA thioester hydrolase